MKFFRFKRIHPKSFGQSTTRTFLLHRASLLIVVAALSLFISPRANAATLPLVDLGEIQSSSVVAPWGYAATGLALSPDEQSLYVGYINTIHSISQYSLPVAGSPITDINDADYNTVYGLNGGAHYPVALATDAAGNVYVANKDSGDIINDLVDSFNSTLGGNVNVITYPDNTHPIGIAVSGSDLYVVHRTTQVLEKRTTGGVFISSIALGFEPFGVEVDPVGNIWAVGASGNIAVYDSSLTPVNTLTIGGAGRLADLAFFDQNAYITERYGSRVFVTDLTPTFVETLDYDPGGGDDRGFYGIDIASSGLIYIAGHWAFTPDGRDHLYSIQLPVPAINISERAWFAVGNNGGTFQRPGCRWTVTIPTGTVPDGSSLLIDCNTEKFTPATGESVKSLDRLVDILIRGPDIKLIHELNLPITICYQFSIADLVNFGDSINSLTIGTTSESRPWEIILSSIGSEKICGSVSHLSLFDLFNLSLPNTGFMPDVVTSLPYQPSELAYTSQEGLWLEIPALGVDMPIVGVPLSSNGWDVRWLSDQAGFLEGTAFPTWEGNTVLTAHVWDANNNPGPFINLKQLEYGDLFYIHAFGQVYSYFVQDNLRVRPNNLSILGHSEYDMVTLVTCESYSIWFDTYRYRRVVQAILIDVQVSLNK